MAVCLAVLEVGWRDLLIDDPWRCVILETVDANRGSKLKPRLGSELKLLATPVRRMLSAWKRDGVTAEADVLLSQ